MADPWADVRELLDKWFEALGGFPLTRNEMVSFLADADALLATVRPTPMIRSDGSEEVYAHNCSMCDGHWKVYQNESHTNDCKYAALPEHLKEN